MAKTNGTMSTNEPHDIISKEIEAFEARLVQQLKSLERRLRDKMGKRLVSARIGAKTANLSESAIRRAAERGTISKYRADGSRKLTNSREPVFYDLREIMDRMNIKTEKVAS